MADVLSGGEAALGEIRPELAGLEQTIHRFEAEAGRRDQTLADLSELREPIEGQGQFCRGTPVLLDGCTFICGVELAGHEAPERVLLVGVGNVGHGRAPAVLAGQHGDLVAAAAVFGIVHTGVIGGQIDDAGVNGRLHAHNSGR